jgi:hypothetical protein
MAPVRSAIIQDIERMRVGHDGMDIQVILDPLTTFKISLHDETGQKKT